MPDIKISRVQILPGVKTFYAIKNSAPFTAYVMDLNNLNILFTGTVLDVPNPEIHVYNDGSESLIVIDDKHFKKTLISQFNREVVPLSQFLKAKMPELASAQLSYFEIHKQYLIAKVDRNINIYDIDKKSMVFSQVG
jgi:hypothetical protein